MTEQTTERRDEGVLAFVEVYALAVKMAETNRDDAIRRAHANGWSMREVAERAGLSKAGVHAIVHAGRAAS